MQKYVFCIAFRNIGCVRILLIVIIDSSDWNNILSYESTLSNSDEKK
jgi:hypothetical protein